MPSGVSILLDLIVAGLLVTVIVFAAILNRRLSVWRQERAEFERLIAEFNRAAVRAETGVERLKAASEQTGKTLQQAVTKGQSLRDDLSYLIERAEPLADRLTEGIRAARGMRRGDPVSEPSIARNSNASARETEEQDERARAKRELLRALAALR
jgi:hypothetical protein